MRVIDAALEAARIRLRPILMTSFAFIFGVLPLALVDRRRRQQPHRHRHLGDRRHADRDAAGDLLHPAVLRAGAPRRPRRRWSIIAERIRGARRAAKRMRTRRRSHRLCLLDRLLLAGAADVPPTPLPVPPSWPAGDRLSARRARRRCPRVTYRDVFRDPRLQTLIVQALANNRDLRIAAANIAAARAQVRITARRAIAAARRDAARARTRRRRRRRHRRPATTSASGSRRSRSTCSAGSRSLTHADQQRLFATEAARARRGSRWSRDIADAWLDLCRRREPAAHRRATPPRAPREACGLTRARLERRHRAHDRPAPGASKSSRPPRATLAHQQTALAQDVNLLQLLVGAPVDPAIAAGLDRASRADRRAASGGARLAASCCAARTWSRPNINCAPPMPTSAPPAPRCSRASR